MTLKNFLIGLAAACALALSGAWAQAAPATFAAKPAAVAGEAVTSVQWRPYRRYYEDYDRPRYDRYDDRSYRLYSRRDFSYNRYGYYGRRYCPPRYRDGGYDRYGDDY